MQVALVSRNLAPFGGGGIGEYVDATARVLAELGEVTVFTTDAHRATYEALRKAGDPERMLCSDVNYRFLPEPQGAAGFYTPLHRYSACLLDAIVDEYPGGGPDLIEASDYLGEAFVLAQAAATRDRRLRRSLLAVRLHTTAEICAVLDGHYDASDFETGMTAEMERYALRHADLLLWPGGDVLGLYRRFYGAGRLAPAVRIRNPLLLDESLPVDPQPTSPDGPLKLLYLGRLERRKGVRNLVHAVSGLSDPNWRLTLLGGDTETGPLGGSQRAQLELMAADDPRIEFLDHVPRATLGRVISAHDVVVLPSLWECWPYVALEAMRRNRPVLATPTGGFTEIIQHGVNGWLTRDTSASALADALDRLLDERDAALEPQRRGTPQATIAALADPREVAERYETLLDEHRPPRRMPRRRTRPLVSVVVPYYRLAKFVEETVRSVVAQTYSPLEIILVNDGSFQETDRVLLEIAARYPMSVISQPNSGLGAARNFGFTLSRGRYVLPLDADNTIAPTFIERCVDVLEAERRVAFVTTWSRYIDEESLPLEGDTIGYQPVGNESPLIHRNNIAGDAAAVIRRRLIDLGFTYSQDLTSYEDWHLYLELHKAGHFGRVIPERLLNYRVRRDSMIRDIGLPRTQRLHGEIQAHVREKEVTWASRSV